MKDTMFASETKEQKSGFDDLFEEMSNAQSGVAKFFLGDDEKKAAKNQEASANAEMTKAMAALATQMANTPPKSQGLSTTTLLIGGGIVLAIGVVVIVMVVKKKRAGSPVQQPTNVAAPAPTPTPAIV